MSCEKIRHRSLRWFFVFVLASFAVLDWTESWADSTWVYSVQITATIQTSPPQIALNWLQDEFGANSYTVYRKGRDDTSWGAGTVLDGTQTTYIDSNVEIGHAYEYQVVKQASQGYVAYGYIYSGIQVPATHSRGKLLLLVAHNLLPALSGEVNRLTDDLTGDGWEVLQHTIDTNSSPAQVRGVIANDYFAAANVKTVFLLGRIPILQSGNLNYDSHGFRPMPADAYYGDVDGDWSGSPSYLPSDVELMVGRVDLCDMPGNGSPSPFPNEIELTRRYLNKDHAWRHAQVSVPQRALMGDRRGVAEGYAPAASGFRLFNPLLGHNATTLANTSDSAPASQRWITRLAGESYLWAYGCAAGQPSGISHLGTRGPYFEAWTIDVVNLDTKAVFVLLYGSWFGNWDVRDNFLRAYLATSSLGLASAMSGEPHWFLHHMGLGEPIGFGTKLTMNNSTLYGSDVNPMNRAVYVALMGDPTLRMHPVPPPGNVSATQEESNVRVTWNAATGPVLGYHVYRAPDRSGPFARLTDSPVTQTEFLDTASPPGQQTYLVRAVREELTPSGSFMNLSQGAFAPIEVSAILQPISLSCQWTENGLMLLWNSEPGRTYRLLTSTNVAGGNWFELPGSWFSDGNFMWWYDADTNLPQKFYRVASP